MSATFTPAPVKTLVSKEALDALDIRVGRIEAVESVAGADRFVALQVNFGDHHRRVVAGIKQERDDVRALIGMQTLFIVNMEVRKIRGVLSEAMLFDIGYADGVLPALAVPDRAIPDGARAG